MMAFQELHLNFIARIGLTAGVVVATSNNPEARL